VSQRLCLEVHLQLLVLDRLHPLFNSLSLSQSDSFPCLEVVTLNLALHDSEKAICTACVQNGLVASDLLDLNLVGVTRFENLLLDAEPVKLGQLPEVPSAV